MDVVARLGHRGELLAFVGANQGWLVFPVQAHLLQLALHGRAHDGGALVLQGLNAQLAGEDIGQDEGIPVGQLAGRVLAEVDEIGLYVLPRSGTSKVTLISRRGCKDLSGDGGFQGFLGHCLGHIPNLFGFCILVQLPCVPNILVIR